MNIESLRKRIDDIDRQLVTLLNKRADLAHAVGRAKAGGAKIRPAREAEVLRRVLAANAGPLTDDSLRAVFREVIAACLALEQPLRVTCLGPAGTYSEEAARTRFGASAVLVPCPTFDDALQTAERRTADLAVLPVENSTEGAVNRTLDLLLKTPLRIIGEINLPVHHQLLSTAPTLTAITTVAGHPQALAQCRDWLQAHLPHAQQQTTDSTAQAAKVVVGQPHMAAIASKFAAHQYKLPILRNDIEDDSANTTRFLILGDVPVPSTGRDRTSLVCSVPNKPGALGGLLAVFTKAGINLTKLVSRPSPTGLWDYTFYIDIDGHRDDQPVSAALKRLQTKALFVKVLGSYPKERA